VVVVVVVLLGYLCSYCPGKVQVFDNGDNEVVVTFYDGRKARLPRSEVFAIPREKHSADKRYILCKEAELVGQVVVAWNKKRKMFELGTLPSNAHLAKFVPLLGKGDRFEAGRRQVRSQIPLRYLVRSWSPTSFEPASNLLQPASNQIA